MSTSIYTLGYAQWSIDEVCDQLDRLDAVLVDVRYRPYTTKPGFAKADLKGRFGDRYVHLPAFGNINYQEGPIELVNPEEGLETARELERPPLFLCGCRSPAECHRSTVARFVSDRLGRPIEHLQAPSERDQHSLFDDVDV